MTSRELVHAGHAVAALSECIQNDRILRNPGRAGHAFLNRTVAGKTVTKQLSAEQLARYQPWFDNARQLRELLGVLEALSLDTISHAEGAKS